MREAKSREVSSSVLLRSPTPADATPTRTSVDATLRLAPGTLLAGRYRIVEMVGIGATGIVYRAHDQDLDLEVALKVLRPDLAPHQQLFERFRKELVLARQVTHRNVVRIHDLGRDGELCFLTMDYVPGRTLREILEEEGPLPVERVVAMAWQVAEALDAAHREGVIHRDLKPSNLLVDEGGRVYITDFGVARSVTAPGLTATGAVVGTPDYLSPEQARGEEVDRRSDLYAFGILLFEMLSGELPFPGESYAEVLAQRISGRPRNLRELGVKVPEGLRKIIRRCLERNPKRRYGSARELLADLATLLPDRPAGHRPRQRLFRTLLRAALWVVLLGAGLGLLWLPWERLPVPGPWEARTAVTAASEPLHVVAVLPFVDESARPELAWTSTGLAEMLAEALAESQSLQVVDSVRMFRTLDDLKLSPGNLGGPDLQRVADLFEADRLLLGRVRSMGEGLWVGVRLVAPDHPRPVVEVHGETQDPSGLYPLIGDLGSRLRQELEVAPSGETAIAHSSSPAALEAYVQGLARLLRGDAVGAAPVLEEAVAVDPGFAAAWLRLAAAYQALGRHDQALAAASRAVESLEPLGPGAGRLGREARARLALLRGEPGRAREILEELVKRYPHDLEARLALAEALGQEGDLERAVAELQVAVERDPRHPRAWFLLGKHAILRGESRRAAEDYLVRALVLQNQLGNEQGKADVLNALGVAYQELGNLAAAADNYRQAAEIRARIGDRRGMATSLKNLGVLALIRGDRTTAQANLDQALDLLHELGDRRGMGEIYDALGGLEEERGRYRQALDFYRRGLQVRSDLGDPRALAGSCNHVGYTYYLLGEYPNALIYWRQARDLYTQSGDRVGQVYAAQGLAILQIARGDWDRALRAFLETLEESRELGLQDAMAVAHGYLGRLAHHQGRYTAALASYDEARTILEEMGDPRGLAEFALLKAELLLELGMAEAAAGALEAAREWLEEGGNHEQRAELWRLQGLWHLRRGEAGLARQALAKAMAESKSSQSPLPLLRATLTATGVIPASGEEPALPRLRSLWRQAEELGHVPLRLEVAEALAKEELARGEGVRAQEVVREALRLARLSGSYGGAHRLHLLHAQVHQAQGVRDEARRELEAAAQHVARLREDLHPPLRQAFDLLPEVREIVEEAKRIGIATRDGSGVRTARRPGG